MYEHSVIGEHPDIREVVEGNAPVPFDHFRVRKSLTLLAKLSATLFFVKNEFCLHVTRINSFPLNLTSKQALGNSENNWPGHAFLHAWLRSKNDCVGGYSEMAFFGHCWFLYHKHWFYYRIWKRWYTVKTQWELSITSIFYVDPDGVGFLKKYPFLQKISKNIWSFKYYTVSYMHY